MRCTETTLTTSDGTPLFVRHCEPDGEPAGRLMIVHGLCEHGERYAHVAEWLADRNWGVVITDLRGHGRSGGDRSHVADFRHYVEDLEVVRSHLGLEPARTALVGHSMGGLIAARYVQTFPASAAALVMLSPLLGVKVAIPRLTVAVGRMLQHVAPRTRFRPRMDPFHTTRNVAAVERRLSDPLTDRSVTAGWFFAMKRALQAAWNEADRLQIPLLVVQAGDDRIVDAAAIEPWLARIGSSDYEFRLVPDNLHELLNEPDWKETAESITVWLEPRLRGLSLLRGPSSITFGERSA